MSEGLAAEVLIVTRTGDFHATVIRDEIRRRGRSAAILETDRIGRGGLRWQLDRPGSARCLDRDGGSVEIAAASVAWWRRLNGPGAFPDSLDESARDLALRDSRATLLGALATDFTGVYVSDPEATRAAENKLVQLRAARAAGFTVPDTVVASDPDAVRDFFAACGGEVVAKTLCGSPGQPFLTGRVHPEHLRPESIAHSPAIYQRYVPGREHLRINAFGDRMVGARLVSDRLDWRYPLDCEVLPWQVPDDLARRLGSVLGLLGLRMGVFDLKLAGDDVVWLEVNPQGQFLWVEERCGLPLAGTFADFLLSQGDACVDATPDGVGGPSAVGSR